MFQLLQTRLFFLLFVFFGFLPSPYRTACCEAFSVLIMMTMATAATTSINHIDKLALILIRGRQQLVAKSRGKSVYFTPGGKREAGESDVEALCRECKEELSVDLVQATIRPYGVFEAQAFGKPAGTMVRMTCYTADYLGNHQASEEVEELTWIDSTFDKEKLTVTGIMILEDLKKKDLID